MRAARSPTAQTAQLGRGGGRRRREGSSWAGSRTAQGEESQLRTAHTQAGQGKADRGEETGRQGGLAAGERVGDAVLQDTETGGVVQGQSGVGSRALPRDGTGARLSKVFKIWIMENKHRPRYVRDNHQGNAKRTHRFHTRRNNFSPKESRKRKHSRLNMENAVAKF